MGLLIREAHREEMDELKKLDAERIDIVFESINGLIGTSVLVKENPNMMGWYFSLGDNKPEKYGYHCIVAIEDHILIGFILIRCGGCSTTEGVRYNKKGIIEKLYVRDSNQKEVEKIYNSLIQKASEWFKEEGADFIEYINSTSEYAKYFHSRMRKEDIFEIKMTYRVDQELNLMISEAQPFLSVRLVEGDATSKMDIENIAKLRTKFFATMEGFQDKYINSLQITSDSVKNTLEEKKVYLVCEYDNCIMGYALINTVAENDFGKSVSTSLKSATAELEELYISEDLRGKQAGRRLIFESKKWCWENDITFLKLKVHGNNWARCLYLQEDFIPTEHVCRFELIP